MLSSSKFILCSPYTQLVGTDATTLDEEANVGGHAAESVLDSSMCVLQTTMDFNGNDLMTGKPRCQQL
jgi:hypothetical protein